LRRAELKQFGGGNDIVDYRVILNLEMALF